MAAEEPFRDLLGHLCAEIERQQAHIDEQGQFIADLQEDNRRLLLELEEARSAFCEREGAPRSRDGSRHGGISPPPSSWEQRAGLRREASCQTLHAGSDSVPTQRQDVGSQTLLCADLSAGDHNDDLACTSLKLSQCGVEEVNLLANLLQNQADDEKHQQPEPAPEPPYPVHLNSAQDAGDVLEVEPIHVKERGTGELTAAVVDDDGPPWSLSPSSLASNTSSPMWLGHFGESFCSPGSVTSPPVTGVDQRSAQQHPQQLQLQQASGEPFGDLRPAGPGLRRQPVSTSRLHPQHHQHQQPPAVSAEAALLSAASSLEPRRLVRSVLDSLDAAQRRLQESMAQQSRAKRAARAAQANSGARTCSQVDIRIYLPGAGSAPDEGASEGCTEEEGGAAVGSFMYILL